MARIVVQEADFDIAAEFAALADGRTDIGGIGCFVGVVRAESPEFIALTLEHYPAMTHRALAAIAATAEQRWHLLGCTVIHRYGRLLPGDNIVLVLTAASHRAAALESTAFLIDWLKTKAPFWKQESFAGRPDRWVEARPEDDAAAARWR
jgi:molybdopterin synthase catalytic subunit